MRPSPNARHVQMNQPEKPARLAHAAGTLQALALASVHQPASRLAGVRRQAGAALAAATAAAARGCVAAGRQATSPPPPRVTVTFVLTTIFALCRA
jgi:hypothetical protein